MTEIPIRRCHLETTNKEARSGLYMRNNQYMRTKRSCRRRLRQGRQGRRRFFISGGKSRERTRRHTQWWGSSSRSHPMSISITSYDSHSPKMIPIQEARSCAFSSPICNRFHLIVPPEKRPIQDLAYSEQSTTEMILPKEQQDQTKFEHSVEDCPRLFISWIDSLDTRKWSLNQSRGRERGGWLTDWQDRK